MHHFNFHLHYRSVYINTEETELPFVLNQSTGRLLLYKKALELWWPQSKPVRTFITTLTAASTLILEFRDGEFNSHFRESYDERRW